MKAKISVALSICAALMLPAGTVAAHAEDLSAAIYSGVSGLRQACGTTRDDPRLTAAAQRHADDLVVSGIEYGHIGSDGSSPLTRILDAGVAKPVSTSEIIFWGSGSHANPSAAFDMWMHSPPHRAVILDCAFTSAGFAVAWSGNTMIAVGDFAGP
jgi:uncharacterized protein YkwD